MSSSSNNNLQVAAISAAAGLAAGALVALVVWRYVASEWHHEDSSTSQKKSLRSSSTGTNSAVPLFDSVQVMTAAQCCRSAHSEAATARRFVAGLATLWQLDIYLRECFCRPCGSVAEHCQGGIAHAVLSWSAGESALQTCHLPSLCRAGFE